MFSLLVPKEKFLRVGVEVNWFAPILDRDRVDRDKVVKNFEQSKSLYKKKKKYPHLHFNDPSADFKCKQLFGLWLCLAFHFHLSLSQYLDLGRKY